MDHISEEMARPGARRTRRTTAPSQDDCLQWTQSHREVLQKAGAVGAISDCLNSIAIKVAMERMSCDDVVHLLGSIMARLQMPVPDDHRDDQLARLFGLTPDFLSRVQDPDFYQPDYE